MSLNDQVYVKPGPGRKVPLPIPGGEGVVPAEGKTVTKSRAVRRLLRTGDLELATAPATAKPAKEG